MDTRNKIVPSARADAVVSEGAVIVSGVFDPMTAEHAKLLREIKGDDAVLVVLVTDSANPILPNRARAELVAGLACVDYVVEGWNGADSDLTPQVRMEQDDARRLEQLIAHVHARQAAG